MDEIWRLECFNNRVYSLGVHAFDLLQSLADFRHDAVFDFNALKQDFTAWLIAFDMIEEWFRLTDVAFENAAFTGVEKTFDIVTLEEFTEVSEFRFTLFVFLFGC